MAESEKRERIMGLSPRAWRRVDRAVRSGNVVVFLSGLTLAVALVGAIVMWLSTDDAFPSLGISLWWALQTVTTVGYGDIVPTDDLGRIIGGLLMVLGVTYVAFMTAVVTSVLVSAGSARLGRDLEESEPVRGHEAGVKESLQRVERRLAAIEEKLPD